MKAVSSPFAAACFLAPPPPPPLPHLPLPLTLLLLHLIIVLVPLLFVLLVFLILLFLLLLPLFFSSSIFSLIFSSPTIHNLPQTSLSPPLTYKKKLNPTLFRLSQILFISSSHPSIPFPPFLTFPSFHHQAIILHVLPISFFLIPYFIPLCFPLNHLHPVSLHLFASPVIQPAAFPSRPLHLFQPLFIQASAFALASLISP